MVFLNKVLVSLAVLGIAGDMLGDRQVGQNLLRVQWSQAVIEWVVIDQFWRPDSPASLSPSVAYQSVIMFENVVCCPSYDAGNLLFLRRVGHEFVVHVPGEVMAIHLIAARIPLAPHFRIHRRTEP